MGACVLCVCVSVVHSGPSLLLHDGVNPVISCGGESRLLVLDPPIHMTNCTLVFETIIVLNQYVLTANKTLLAVMSHRLCLSIDKV